MIERRKQKLEDSMTDNSTKIKHFCDNEINILSLVDSMTGKSTMIKRFCENRFEKRFLPTIGVDYGTKALSIQVGGGTVDVRVNFWNLSGDPDYAEVRNEIYEDVDAAFLVFDVSDDLFFESLETWLSQISRYRFHCTKIPLALCANKIDICNRTISEKQGSQYAASKNVQYFETSVYNGNNIANMFQHLIRCVVENSQHRL